MAPPTWNTNSDQGYGMVSNFIVTPTLSALRIPGTLLHTAGFSVALAAEHDFWFEILSASPTTFLFLGPTFLLGYFLGPLRYST